MAEPIVEQAGGKRPSITIPAPIGYPGDMVRVLNYKMRPAAWEDGELRSAEFSPAYQLRRQDGSRYKVKARWVYSVWIDRPATEDRYGRRRGGGYSITVADDAIREGEEG
jgi:hypothetical protein